MQDTAPKATPPSGARARPAYVLRFISGPYEGSEYPLLPGNPVFVGRSSDLEMVLVEDMVSRKHARFQVQNDEIWIEDLGSTNGTFVNGERIKRAMLRGGDRVLIGTSILKLIVADEGDAVPRAVSPEPKPAQRSGPSSTHIIGMTDTRILMSGKLDELPLPDLLQLFGTSKKNGVLAISNGPDRGRIDLKKGNISYAIINDLDDVPPLKSIYRMLTWQTGDFQLQAPDNREFPNEENFSVQELLMEGIRQLDEFNRLRPELPDMHARLSPPIPLFAPLRDLSQNELDVWQLFLNYGDLAGVLNKSQLTDLDTAEIVLKLMKARYLDKA